MQHESAGIDVCSRVWAIRFSFWQRAPSSRTAPVWASTSRSPILVFRPSCGVESHTSTSQVTRPSYREQKKGPAPLRSLAMVQRRHQTSPP